MRKASGCASEPIIYDISFRSAVWLAANDSWPRLPSRHLAFRVGAETQFERSVGSFDQRRLARLYLFHQLHEPGAALDHVVLDRLPSRHGVAAPERAHNVEVLMAPRIGGLRVRIEVLQQRPIPKPDALKNGHQAAHIRSAIDQKVKLEVGERRRLEIAALFRGDKLPMQLIEPREVGGSDERGRLFGGESFQKQANFAQLLVARQGEVGDRDRLARSNLQSPLTNKLHDCFAHRRLADPHRQSQFADPQPLARPEPTRHQSFAELSIDARSEILPVADLEAIQHQRPSPPTASGEEAHTPPFWKNRR